MLGRLMQCHNEPKACTESAAPMIRDQAADLEKELKQGLELVFEFNKKLSGFSWMARDIITGWLRDPRQ